MVTSLKNLKNEVDSRLAGGGLSALACCQLQNAETILDNNIVYSVPNIASLPCNTLNEGRFVYVEDIKEYRLANDTSWTDDVSSGICIYQNQLWGWGRSGACVSVGDGTATNRCSPVREICSATDWCQVSAGDNSNMAIKTNGELWGWGANDSRQLGDGTLTARCSPVREICSATDWCQVNVGRTHTAAVKSSGELWTWGSGSCGLMGDGTVTDRLSPVREICSATNWCQASAGYRLTTAIKTLGELWTWGFNLYGGLGDGTVTSRCSPVREICSATNWCQASAGRTRISALKTSGEIWSWGYNRCGQLGDGTQTDRCSPVREICSATDWCQLNSNNHNFVVAIKTSGELWAWGTGTQGELGDGTQTNKCSPVREISSATDWCQAGAGRLHAVAVKTSGQLWVWGGGSCGRLGNGTISNRCSPVREFSCSTDWTQVSAGEYNTMAIKSVTKGFLE